MTPNERLVLQAIANFADTHGINKSEIARNIGVTPKTVRNITNKFKLGGFQIEKSKRYCNSL